MTSQTNLKILPFLLLALLLPPRSIQAQTCVPAPSGLVSWWQAESNALDSADGNNGSLIGNVTYAPGKAGKAFSFDGGDNHVSIPSTSNINSSGNMPMTIETWVYRTGSATTMHILGKRNGCYLGEIQYQLAFDPTGGLSFIGNAGNFWVNTYRQLPMNTWQHLAVTYDGTNAVIFIDGQPVASGSGSLGPALAAPLKIGSAGSCGADYSAAFAGLIDEVSIYDRALSTDEVQSIYTAGSAGKCPPPSPVTCVSAPPGLVSWWRGESNGSDFIGNNPTTALNNLGFVKGKVGQALDFNGNTSSMVIPASPTLHVGAGSGFSIETWIKPTTIDLQRPIVEWNSVTGGNPYPYGVHLWISVPVGYGDGPGSLYANVVDTDGAFHPFTSAGGLITTNVHQHVALTYDRASGQARLYVDGNVVASQNLGSFTPQTSYNLYLGNRPDEGPGAGSWAGQMDELSIYNRALTSNEIAGIFLAATAGKCLATNPPPAACTAAPSGLISWWRGEANALDQAGTNSGTLVGNTTFASGRVGQGFVLDGNGASVQLGNPTSLHFQDLTIETWNRRASAAVTSLNGNGNGVIFGYNIGGYGIYLDPNGTPTLSKIGIDEVKPGVTITDTNLHHVAVTKSGSTVVFYVDGVAYPAAAYDPGFTFSENAFIGGLENNYTFYGTVDEVSVYNRALAANEIQSIYNASSAGKCVPDSPTSCTPAPSGLVSWWRAESDALDSVDANNGVFVNGDAFALGQVGQAFNFWGTNHVEVAAAANLSVQSFTIEAWIFPDDVSITKPIVEYAAATGYPGVHLWHSVPADGSPGVTPGSLYANVGFIFGPYHFGTVGGVIPPRQWTHVALTFDQPSGMARLFVNGTNLATASMGSITPATDLPLNLGYRPAGSPVVENAGFRFVGKMDEVSIYSRAFSTNEVQAIYNAGSAGKCPPIPPIAKAIVSPLAQFPGLTNPVVISPNNSNAIVVLDGSLSTDSENDPLQYSWLEGTNVIATGATVTNLLSVGTRTITLMVTDGTDTATDTVTLEVITPEQAVEVLMRVVDQANLVRKHEKALLESLKASGHAFQKGKSRQGVKRLSTFQAKVRTKMAPVDQALADSLISGAQLIINAQTGP